MFATAAPKSSPLLAFVLFASQKGFKAPVPTSAEKSTVSSAAMFASDLPVSKALLSCASTASRAAFAYASTAASTVPAPISSSYFSSSRVLTASNAVLKVLYAVQ